MQQVSDFLAMNPSESVILMMKQEYLSGGATPIALVDAVSMALDDAGTENFWMIDAVPDLGDVRGKSTVIIRDGLGAPQSISQFDLGINVTWQDNQTRKIEHQEACSGRR